MWTFPYAAPYSDFVLPFFVKYDIFMLSVVSFPFLSTDVKSTLHFSFCFKLLVVTHFKE